MGVRKASWHELLGFGPRDVLVCSQLSQATSGSVLVDGGDQRSQCIGASILQRDKKLTAHRGEHVSDLGCSLADQRSADSVIVGFPQLPDERMTVGDFPGQLCDLGLESVRQTHGISWSRGRPLTSLLSPAVDVAAESFEQCAGYRYSVDRQRVRDSRACALEQLVVPVVREVVSRLLAGGVHGRCPVEHTLLH